MYMIMIISSIIVDHVERIYGSAMMTRNAAGNHVVGGMGMGLGIVDHVARVIALMTGIAAGIHIVLKACVHAFSRVKNALTPSNAAGIGIVMKANVHVYREADSANKTPIAAGI